MLTDSERFAFSVWRIHAFASTGNAYDAVQTDETIAAGDLPPADPAVITRVCRFDIRARPSAQARRVGRFHLAGTPGALVPAFGSPEMSAV